MRDELASSNGSGYDLALLERIRQPLIVLDANRRIVYRNASGGEVLERGDPIEDRGGFAVCADAASDEQLVTALRGLTLSEALGRARASWNRQSLWLKRGDESGDRLLSTLTALRSQPVVRAFGNMPLALLTIYEPGLEKDIDTDALIEMFSLTRAEARVASRLVSGLSVQEVAKEFGVGVTTVRSQLKALFEKTGTRRQAELVRLLLLATEV
jgi:DNA-binding CsgD family transcriptional regulator